MKSTVQLRNENYACIIKNRPVRYTYEHETIVIRIIELKKQKIFF